MLVVLIGVILLFANTNIGIFVIILGVMIWTSGKSRRNMAGDPTREDARLSDPETRGPSAQIVAIRRDSRRERSHRH
jgi:hypothetical protein